MKTGLPIACPELLRWVGVGSRKGKEPAQYPVCQMSVLIMSPNVGVSQYVAFLKYVQVLIILETEFKFDSLHSFL